MKVFPATDVLWNPVSTKCLEKLFVPIRNSLSLFAREALSRYPHLLPCMTRRNVRRIENRRRISIQHRAVLPNCFWDGKMFHWNDSQMQSIRCNEISASEKDRYSPPISRARVFACEINVTAVGIIRWYRGQYWVKSIFDLFLVIVVFQFSQKI